MALTKQKIILDTDIGSDIDDAVALAWLLAQPKCELLGVTTVSGEPEKRAKLASALCRHAGKDIPIFPGVEAPLLQEQRQPRAPQASALRKWSHQKTFPKHDAIPFLRHAIRSNPGEVTLLAIGPLTNLGLLFAADPEIPSLLKGLYLMGGVFQQDCAWRGCFKEWNIMCDPHAASLVYRASVPLHRSIGLDVTSKVTMKAPEVRRRFKARALAPVLDFAGVWFKHASVMTFHDPLAALTIFDERICTFKAGKVVVETGGSVAQGLTEWQPDKKGPHEIAVEVNPERFFKQYFEVFGK